MEKLAEEMQIYYETIRYKTIDNNMDFQNVKGTIFKEMDTYLERNPELPAVALKAELHQCIARNFNPVIFPNSPFYYEMGLRAAENWGNPDPVAPSCWFLNQNYHKITGDPIFRNISSFARGEGALGLSEWQSVFDSDHHSIGTTKLLEVGVNGLLMEIRQEMLLASGEKLQFLQAAEKSCLAIITIANRFADKAEAMLAETTDQQERNFLTMIAETARKVPANPPASFYEGLAALWFLREVFATMEGIGISVIGHPDRQLLSVYEADIQKGRMTEAEARDLLARWMLPTDIKFAVHESSWPETSTCMELGGCDKKGQPVWNDITRLIIETHEQHHLLNPKLNCRYSAASPAEYLETISRSILRGHNNFALINDDVMIPACVKSGKTIEEARAYVNGGCQETIVEGVEHSAGAFYYFNMPRVLDLCLQPAPKIPEGVLGPNTLSFVPDVICFEETFEGFYTGFTERLKNTISAGADWRRILGINWTGMHPCPLFSATLAGCIEKGLDYTAGGAKYNTSAVAAVGFATVVDSLYAIKMAVYDEKWLTLDELKKILDTNWDGAENLRLRFIDYPKYGHGDLAVDRLAARFSHDLSEMVRTMKNERGGFYQPSFFTYYAFEYFAPFVRATPDGRRNGDLLSQGVAPGRLRGTKSLTDVVRSINEVDFTEHAGNAVLDIQLPVNSKMDASILASFLKTFAEAGGPTLQPNSVSIEDLMEAKEHPELHKNLIVRISGLSALFIALEASVQNEIIARNMYAGEVEK